MYLHELFLVKKPHRRNIGFLSPRHGAPQVEDGGTPAIWRLAASILHKQLRTSDKEWFSSSGLSEMLTIPHHKKLPCYERSLLSGAWPHM